MSSTNQQLGYVSPATPSLASRINIRIIAFAVIMLGIVGLPFGLWLYSELNGGVVNHGSYASVDLKAMSLFDMDQYNATMEDIPKKWRDLEGRKVLMTGEMWHATYAGNDEIRYFQLVYSIQKCCFNGPRLAQHFVDGKVVKGAHAKYYDGVVEVFGTVHVSINKDKKGVITSIYHVDVDDVRPID